MVCIIGKVVVMLVCFVLDESGVFFGVVGVMFNFGFFEKFLVSVSVGLNGMLFICCSDDSWLVVQNLLIVDVVDSLIWEFWIQKMIDVGEFQGSFVEGSLIGECGCIFSFCKVVVYFWYVVVVFFMQDVMVDWQKWVYVVVVIFFVIGGGVLVLIWVLSCMYCEIFDVVGEMSKLLFVVE